MADNIAITQSTPLFAVCEHSVYLVVGWRSSYGASSALLAQVIPLFEAETPPAAQLLPAEAKFFTDFGQASREARL